MNHESSDNDSRTSRAAGNVSTLDPELKAEGKMLILEYVNLLYETFTGNIILYRYYRYVFSPQEKEWYQRNYFNEPTIFLRSCHKTDSVTVLGVMINK